LYVGEAPSKTKPHRCIVDYIREGAHANKGAELMTDDFYAYRSVGEQQKRHGVVGQEHAKIKTPKKRKGGRER
jgi:hypothetical protein